MRHLLDTTDLSLDEIDNIIATAIDIINNKEKYSHICDGKKLATLFFEPSTRTRLSFEAVNLTPGCQIHIKKSDITTKLIKLKPENFYEVLNKKIIERRV